MNNSETGVKTNERRELASRLVTAFPENEVIGYWAQMTYLREINRDNSASPAPPDQG